MLQAAHERDSASRKAASERRHSQKPRAQVGLAAKPGRAELAVGLAGARHRGHSSRWCQLNGPGLGCPPRWVTGLGGVHPAPPQVPALADGSWVLPERAGGAGLLGGGGRVPRPFPRAPWDARAPPGERSPAPRRSGLGGGGATALRTLEGSGIRGRGVFKTYFKGWVRQSEGTHILHVAAGRGRLGGTAGGVRPAGSS